ncbi:hypothetical protein SAMN03159341_14116 [Paenibacillus sp. 1_12]|uniref:hypothetical protein n=1 Tax=Paenibacillus sp. 1_12 TaxID=1566278 RepID=UPI0008E0FC9E|nr:hypothetical protein [Paenibacillus sp. 1_12]SFM51574.1 hypothetical protein SAMN03159341_14116 [Paenibacillus sp. 1_12]
MFKINLLTDGQEKVSLIGRRIMIPLNQRVMQQIEEAPKSTVFVYDMEQVEGMNGSGIDEVIVKPLKWIRQEYKTQDKYLFLINLSEEEDHLYNLKKTLRDEDVVVVANYGVSLEIIGDLGEVSRELLEFTYKHKQITARFASDSLDKKLNLVSTQLTKLNELRLLKRQEEQLEEGGRQFVYSSLF